MVDAGLGKRLVESGAVRFRREQEGEERRPTLGGPDRGSRRRCGAVVPVAAREADDEPGDAGHERKRNDQQQLPVVHAQSSRATAT